MNPCRSLVDSSQENGREMTSRCSSRSIADLKRVRIW